MKRGRSIEKRCGCVFIYLIICVVYLEEEVVLNFDLFIMVFRRIWFSRRGNFKIMCFDNGIKYNFVGVNRYLGEVLK